MSDDQYAFTLPFVAWQGAFTKLELDEIERYGDTLKHENASLHDGAYGRQDAEMRKTQTAWVERGPQTEWFYERLERVARSLNEKIYQFDLRGFSGPFQYSIYNASEGGFFDWHVDQGPLRVQRKLSFSLQLSAPSQYEGCELQFFTRRVIDSAPKERGVVIAFPSYVMHRVTPITSGTRKALVFWTSGPKFK